MLLFTPENAAKVLAGAKTQTRRLWDKPRVKVGSFQKCYTGGMPFSRCPACRGQSGHWGPSLVGNGLGGTVYVDCEICGNTGYLQPFAIVLVKRVWRQRLYAMWPENVKAEGYETYEEFKTAFVELNQNKWVSRMQGGDAAEPIRVKDLTPVEQDGLLPWAVEFRLAPPAEARR